MPSQAPRQIKTTVGLNLSVARRAKRLTPRELAQLIDTDAFQVSRWERGVVRPTDVTLARLAEALGVEFAWFFTDHGTRAAA
jgi:transcriptional regulator with XRE-family HTH domain